MQNSECPTYQKCFLSKCVDSCMRYKNGEPQYCSNIQSYCHHEGPHHGVCKCAGMYEGDPYEGCTKVIITVYINTYTLSFYKKSFDDKKY